MERPVEPNRADHLADLDVFADLDADLGEMAVAGRQPVAVIDLDHAAIAAGPARRHHLAVGGDAHRIALSGAEVEAGVHCRSPEEGSLRTPKPLVNSTSPTTGLRYGTSASVWFRPLHLGAIDIDAVELTLERAGVGRELHRNEQAAHAAARQSPLRAATC